MIELKNRIEETSWNVITDWTIKRIERKNNMTNSSSSSSGCVWWGLYTRKCETLVCAG